MVVFVRALPARLAVLALLAVLPGCVIGDKAGGVLPSEPVAPPPFLRSETGARPVAGVRSAEPAARPDHLRRPDERLAQRVPAGPAPRRIRREDLDPEEPSTRATSVAPVITPGGGVGLGGRF